MRKIDVRKIEMSGPDDTRALKSLIDEGAVDPKTIIAVLGKTEGNGCVNDFTRGLATLAFKRLIAAETGWSEDEVSRKVAFVMSGGTEGVLAPHALVFCSIEAEGEPSAEKTLAASSGFTRDFLPEEQGTMAVVEECRRVTL